MRNLQTGEYETREALRAVVEIGRDESLDDAAKVEALQEKAKEEGWSFVESWQPQNPSQWLALLTMAIMILAVIDGATGAAADQWREWTDDDWQRVVKVEPQQQTDK